MREGMLSHCDIETGVYVGYKEGKSMARKLARRHTGYIAGSVAMKEELAPKKKRKAHNKTDDAEEGCTEEKGEEECKTSSRCDFEGRARENSS